MSTPSFRCRVIQGLSWQAGKRATTSKGVRITRSRLGYPSLLLSSFTLSPYLLISLSPYRFIYLSPYLKDNGTGETTYEDPREKAAAEAAREAELGPLPRAWEMIYDQHGQLYFQKALPKVPA